jgi:hypothetical protein
MVEEIYFEKLLTFLDVFGIAKKKLLWHSSCKRAYTGRRIVVTNRVHISRIVEGVNPDKTD